MQKNMKVKNRIESDTVNKKAIIGRVKNIKNRVFPFPKLSEIHPQGMAKNFAEA